MLVTGHYKEHVIVRITHGCYYHPVEETTTSPKELKHQVLERSGAKFTSVALILSAFSSNPQANARSVTTRGESGVFLQRLADVVPSPQSKFGGPTSTQGEAVLAASICQSPSHSSRFACTIALCLALVGIIADPTTCHAQSPSARTPATSENARTPDVNAAQNEIANPTYDNDPIDEKTNALPRECR
jgi:hypothetical protein